MIALQKCKGCVGQFTVKESIDIIPSKDLECSLNHAKLIGEEFKHKHSLSEAVMDNIKPIFHDLSNDNLLYCCCLGKTKPK